MTDLVILMDSRKVRHLGFLMGWRKLMEIEMVKMMEIRSVKPRRKDFEMERY